MIAESMTMDSNANGHVAILKVHGMLANRPNLMPFYNQVAQLQAEGQTHIVVDLSGITGCGAALLGWLINTQQTLRAIGGELFLSSLSDRMTQILKLTRLSDQFQTFKTSDQAITQLQKRSLCCAA